MGTRMVKIIDTRYKSWTNIESQGLTYKPWTHKYITAAHSQRMDTHKHVSYIQITGTQYT